MSRLDRLRALALAATLILAAAPAFAQSADYDSNCDPRNYTADEMLQQELCSAHVGCWLTQKAATSACKVKDFFSNLSGVLGGRSTPDNLDVMEALNRTEVPQTSGVKKTNASARPYYEGSRLPSYDRTNAAQISVEPPMDGRPSGSLNREKDGTVRWFEGTGARNASNQLSGNGVQIDSTGRIRAGIVIDDAIGGGGIARTPDASWAGGNFKAGRLDGDGYRLQSDGTGNAPVLEGTFKNNQPDGMMLATYPDFSSRKELWRGGKLIAAGPTVPKGSIPSNPKTPEEEAAEKMAAAEAKFTAELRAQKSAGSLYALGDELAAKGETEKAQRAWRDLIRRFPESQLAASAADRLSGRSGPSTTSSPSASTSAGAGDSSPAGAGFYDVTLVDRWAGTWESQPLLRVPESAYDQTLANFKQCGSTRRCGPEWPISESPFAYDVGNIVNPFQVSGAVPQQTPYCKYSPQAGYTLPYLPGSKSAFGLGGGVPGEQTCAYLLQWAIHEWMDSEIGTRRGASTLVSAAPVMPGTATGQCEADLRAYRDGSAGVQGLASPMEMRKSLQIAMYLEVNMYRILTTSCKGTSHADNADMYLQSAGQSLRTCQIMTSDPNVCVPKIP